MARSVRGRIHNGGLPSWPPLRTRAVVNGLCLTVFGSLLFHITWNMLNFQVYDAHETAMVLRVLAIWLAVGLPLGCVAIGIHLVLTAATARDRLLLSHGAAAWDPGEQDAVLRGVRVRNWRPATGSRPGAFSARTLGWVPVQTPLALLPLGLGVVVGLGLMIWLATGYGRAALILWVTIAWLAWRSWRAWGGWTDFRTDRQRRPGSAQQSPDGSRVVVITADEAWDHDDDVDTHHLPAHPDPYQREQQLRQAMADEAPRSRYDGHDRLGGDGQLGSNGRLGGNGQLGGNDVRVEAIQDPNTYRTETTDLIPVYADDGQYPGDESTGEIPVDREQDTAPLHPDDRKPRRPKRTRVAAEDEQVVLVDRSAQRAHQARLKRNGQSTDAPAGRRPGRRPTSRQEVAETEPTNGRGRGRGLRKYLGERVTDDPAAHANPGNPAADARTSQMRTVRRSGAPSKAEAEREIYDRKVEADSIFGYVMGKRRED
ncbi:MULTISPECIES: hypothetical protein [Kocuria]|uniref:Uncharacterized protein n=1 Tax=Kocuria subflava TaxID=1736139 RepID=A0A846TVV1_9MICC|nr:MULTISPECIES: hypothetical protein [Kocuria]NKE09892.1 hypothetical protein [Kocuria subflava]